MAEVYDYFFADESTESEYYEVQEPPGVTQLRFNDYSLDSPIILDNLEVARDNADVSENRLLPHIASLCNLYKLMENPLTPADGIRMCFSFCLTKIDHLMEQPILVQSIADDLTQTFTPPSSLTTIFDVFFKHQTPENTDHASLWMSFLERIEQTRFNLDDPIITYWGLYKEFHALVLIMNRVNDEELNEIRTSYSDCLEHITVCEDNQLIDIRSTILGSLVMNKEGVAFPDLGFVLDRNLTLMFQDMFSNRVNTLMLLKYPDERYTASLKVICKDLYKLGDKLIIELGNPAYDIIKMIEPLSNNMIRKLAEKDYEVMTSIRFQAYLLNEQALMEAKYGRTCINWFSKIREVENVYDCVFVYGMYRHWGHPFIEYYDGLNKLHQNVTMKKTVNLRYVDNLASDLARKIMRHAFKRDKKWPLSKESLATDHPFFIHVRDSTWPNRAEERNFGDNWHLLPMEKVFDIPSSVSLSEVLDDKSHSLNLKELINAIREGHVGLSRNRKVLLSTLLNPEIDIDQFLNEINLRGFLPEDLVIGLRAKERELKRIGRFFALMTLKLRLYFVVTEMLIAKNILPLFPSITMTNSLLDVFKKMSACVPGHGTSMGEVVSYAEHFDYEKWNNHQRYESTASVFEVMDRAFGFQNLIKRTHQIFQDSFIYFANKPEHMMVIDDRIVNRPSSPLVCWQGQAGGLEGLRQKGWSVISLLMINRESRNRNPRVRTLAQGDNQVVCITYALPKAINKIEYHRNYRDIYKNKEYLLKCIHTGAEKLGLLIKPDESWGSFNYMVYGKFALVGGNLICSEAKRYSRVNHVSNDQIQNLSNTLSAIVTTCLTVCQQSDSTVKSIHMYGMYGSCGIRQVLRYNLSVCRRILSSEEINKLDLGLSKTLLLDSSIGGMGGSSLLRFFIRQFPDSVTESLTFWKIIYTNLPPGSTRKMAVNCGHPQLKSTFELMDIMKLVESPTSINCEYGASTVSILKTLVRDALCDKAPEIQHTTIRESLLYSKLERINFLHFLHSISPKFPRFLSNFYSSSIHGFTDSIIGLVQNSRTIRMLFTPRLSRSLCERVQENELNSIGGVLKIGTYYLSEWECSATHADLLRERSWGKTVGATIPHPAELLRLTTAEDCTVGHQTQEYITCHYKPPIPFYPHLIRGPCRPYMGSSTSDLTDMYHVWEKKTDYLLLKKAIDLRVTLKWFVEPGGVIHKALIANLQSMTDDAAEELMTPGPERGGSYIHRYRTPYQSAGGFSSVNFNKLSYILITTDTMRGLNRQNWDFMHQSAILYMQTVLLSQSDDCLSSGIYHGHIGCQNCLRPVDNTPLDSCLNPPNFPTLSSSSSLFIPKGKIPFTISQLFVTGVPYINTREFSGDISYEIGSLQGFLHTISHYYSLGIEDLGQLFPQSVFEGLIPGEYLQGFLIGVIRGSIIISLPQQFIYSKRDRVCNIKGQVTLSLSKLTETKDISSMISVPQFSRYLGAVSSITGAQYPLNENEVLNLLRTFLIGRVNQRWESLVRKISQIHRVILFPETLSLFIAYGLLFSISLVRDILVENTLERKELKRIKEMMILANNPTLEDKIPMINFFQKSSVKVYICEQDLRTISKAAFRVPTQIVEPPPVYTEYEGVSRSCKIQTVTRSFFIKENIMPVADRYCPLISGLRVFQIQTGSHYKLKSILAGMKQEPNYVICGGDFSGGFTSVLLRKYPNCHVAFNSLLDLSKFPGGGIHPAPPSAISRLEESRKSRCVNLHSAWEEPSDLCKEATWACLLKKFPVNSVDLLIIDADVKSIDSANRMAEMLNLHLPLFHPKLKVIYKCYYSLLRDPNYRVLDLLGSAFDDLSGTVTEYSGSFSSEFYVVCSNIRRTSCPRYVDVSSYDSLQRIIPAFNSPEEEFSRALRLDPSKTCQGLMEKYWVSGQSLLNGLLIRMSIAPVLGVKITEEVCAQETIGGFIGIILFAVAYISKELNRRTDARIDVIDGLPVPSADWMEELTVFLFGTLYYLSYIMRNVNLFKRLVDCTSIAYHIDVVEKQISWALFRASPKGQSVRVRISRKKHLMATWIRLWEIFRIERSINGKVIEFEDVKVSFMHALAKVKYRYINPKFLRKRTGFMEMFDLVFPSCPDDLFKHSCNECPRQDPPERFSEAEPMDEVIGEEDENKDLGPEL